MPKPPIQSAPLNSGHVHRWTETLLQNTLAFRTSPIAAFRPLVEELARRCYLHKIDKEDDLLCAVWLGIDRHFAQKRSSK